MEKERSWELTEKEEVASWWPGAKRASGRKDAAVESIRGVARLCLRWPGHPSLPALPYLIPARFERGVAIPVEKSEMWTGGSRERLTRASKQWVERCPNEEGKAPLHTRASRNLGWCSRPQSIHKKFKLWQRMCNSLSSSQNGAGK